MKLKEKFKIAGQRWTRQREIIAGVMERCGEHVSAEEIYRLVKEEAPEIGFATVYRTLRLMKDCGVLHKREFGDGRARFEAHRGEGEHHDHLICEECGRVIEFENREIEELQRYVAKKYRFQMNTHRLDIFGRCSVCRKGNGSK